MAFVWSHMCGGTMRASADGAHVQRVRLYLGKRAKSSTSSGGDCSNLELASVCQPHQPPPPPPPHPHPHPASSTLTTPPPPPASNPHH